MSYVYAKVDDLDGTDKVGSHQCVALVQHYAKAPPTGSWTQGEDQWNNDKVKPKVSRRYVTRKGKDAKGNFIDASNNADAYAVIE